MKKIIIIACSVSSLLLFEQCEVSQKKLRVINDSNSAIYYRILLEDSIIERTDYVYECLPGDTAWPDLTRSRSENAWEYRINNGSLDSTLKVFIFKTNKLTDSIINNRQYFLQKYKVKELEEKKWTLFYPDDFD